MPLTVGRVENLFWANNSYKKPNCAPTFAESQEINQRPVIYGFMGGRTHLYGDQWNYAIYKGVYYFLKIEDCKDLEKKHYSYVLLRDLWVNMITNHNIEVQGFLSTTSRDEWLEANLNRTYPTLVQPCNVTRLSLIEAKQKLSETSVIKSGNPLSMILFDIRELREIKSHWNVAIQKYKTQLDKGKYIKGDSPIFLFAELKGKRVDSVHSWKEYLRVKINELLDDLGNEDIVISKVQSTEGAGRLKDHYCITWKTGGIGVGIENVVIDKIDLQGLEDIVFINPKTLEEGEALKSINESLFADISFPSGYESKLINDASELQIQKLRRKIYFPFTQDPERYGVSLAPWYSNGGYYDNKIQEINWWYEPPQQVKLKGLDIKELFLFWIDNVNFHLNYNETAFITETGAVSQGGGFVETWKATAKSYSKAFRYMGVTKLPQGFILPYPFYGFDDFADETWFFNNKYITPFGFLIFKPFNRDYLDGYIWKGESTSKLHYISGLRKSRLKRIQDGSAFTNEPVLSNLNPLPYNIWTYYNRDDRADNSDNWNRYWFNITNGLDIVLQPNYRRYTNSWRTWRPDDKTSHKWARNYLQYDQEPWLNNKAPFYSAERHKSSINRSRRLVDWLVMKTLMELPIILNTDDYLFNDMEYWASDYDTTLWTDNDGLFAGYPVMRWLFKLEDYVRTSWYIRDTGTNSAVICNTREGDIEIRECIRFRRIHRLHDDIYSQNLADTRTDIDGLDGFGGSKEAKIANLTYSTNDLQLDEQAVENVSGHVSQDVGYMALKKVDRGRIEKINEPLPNDAITRIIAIFLRANGYKLSHDNQSVLYFERSDFNGPTDLFFDLKGTEWYAHVKAGKISLIAKNPSLFRGDETTVNKLKENEYLKGLSVLEKINQRCVLNVYTQQRMLNTRFNFNNDKLNLFVKALKPTHKNNPTNYYQMNLRGDFDVIEREILTIQKKQLDEQATIIDYTALETLRAQMRRDDRDYEISVARDVLLATEKENEHYRRQKWDLSTQRMQMWMNLGLGLGQSGTSMMAGQYISHFKQTGQAASNVAQSAAMGVMGAVTKGLGAVAAVGGAIRSIAGAVVSNQIFDEKAKRIETDRKFAFQDIAYRGLQIDLRHRDVQEDSIRQLNKLANVYNKGVINDLDAIEEFNKENALGNINLTIFTPSKEQLYLLTNLKEEYGVDCDIPNAVIHIGEGMSEDVIRFSHLSGSAIKGLSNDSEREYLMSILEMGIKVVDTCRGDSRRRTRRELYACANIYELTKQIEDHRILSENTGQINAELRDEISRLKADVDAKVHEIDDKRSTIEQLSTRLNQCLEDVKNNVAVAKAKEECDKALAAKEEELTKAKAAYDKTIADKEAEIANERSSKKEIEEELTQKLNDERRRFLDEQDKANSLNKHLKDKESELANVKSQCDADKKALEAQVKEWKDKYINRPRVEWKETVGQCQLFRKMLDEPYIYDLKTRANGWDAFMDLVFAIAEDIKWAELSRIQERLSGMPEMTVIFERLHDLEKINIVQKALNIVKDGGWESYKRWRVQGGAHNGAIDAIIKNVNEIKDLETNPTIHAVKDVMDEMNYLSYIALNSLHEKIGGNEDLEFFFAHIYPGNLMDKYEALFGDANKGIIRKRYVAEATCQVDAGGATFQALTAIKDQTKLKEKMGSAIKGPKDPTPAPKPDTPPPPEYKGAVSSMDEAKYSGILLKDIDNAMRQWMYDFASPIFAFEDAYVSRNLENPGYRWNTRNGTAMSLNVFSGVTGLEFWKWPYSKKAEYWSSYKKVIWFKWRAKYTSSSDGSIEQYGNYIEAQDLKIEDTLSTFDYLINNLKNIIIPEDILVRFKRGTTKLKLHLKNWDYVARTDGISGKIIRFTEDVSFGQGFSQLLWPEEHIDKFLKIIFVLHYIYMDPVYYGKDVDDKYNVYGFDVGKFHPSVTDLRKDQLIKAINRDISNITDTTIDLKLGILFTVSDRRILFIDSAVAPDLHAWRDHVRENTSNEIRTCEWVAFATLYAWMWGMWSNRHKKFYAHSLTHPYTWGYNTNSQITGAMRLMFRRMSHVANSK